MESLRINKNSDYEDTIINDLDGSNDEAEECSQHYSSSDAVQKYDRSFLKYGFTYTGSEDHPLPECIVCGEKLSNESMIANRLKKHFQIKHGDLVNALLYDYFEGKLKDRGATFTERKQSASYRVAEMIAYKSHPHTIAETLILPACKEMVKCLLGETVQWEISQIPLSSVTISRRIGDMSADIQKQLTENLHDKKFALYLDVAPKSRLLCYVRFFNGVTVDEQFLTCMKFPRTVNTSELYYSMTAMLMKNKLCWDNCVSVCMDNTQKNIHQSLISALKRYFPNIGFSYCLLYREILIAETIPESLKSVMETVIEMVKYIKARPEETEVIRMMCQEAGVRHETLVLHTNIHWMSRGKTFRRFYEQHKELIEICSREKPELAALITNAAWYSKLAYLVDIVEELNNLSASMRWNEETIFTYSEKLHEFLRKIKIWKARVGKNDLTMFPLASKVVAKITPSLILEHLSALENALSQYLPPFDLNKYNWVRNPFAFATAKTRPLPLNKSVELEVLQADKTLCVKFRETSLIQFWSLIRNRFPMLADEAISVLLHFSTTYLNELGSSALLNIIHKREMRLSSVEDELRVCLSTIQPRIELLCKNK